MRRDDLRLITSLLFIALWALLTPAAAAAQNQNVTPTASRPTLLRCIPSSVTPKVYIRLEGSHFSSLESIVLFVQEEQTYRVKPVGAGKHPLGDSQETSEHVSLAVPEGLKPGRCQILIEVNGVASTPLMIKIAPAVLPVEIRKPKPLVALPGEDVEVEALGIGNSDEFELIDAAGEIRYLDVSIDSSGIKAHFTLPDDLPGGKLKFCIVEKRSGLNQRSNRLVLQIETGPQPLILYQPEYNVEPLAPGQWLVTPVENEIAAERAERLEVAFIQKKQIIVAASLFPPNSRLHVKVPTSLSPGAVKMKTRTWLNGRVSSWSKPFEFTLLAQPVAPYLWSMGILKPQGMEQTIYFKTSEAKVIIAQSGNILMVSGLFLVESVSQLQITLKGQGQQINLKPVDEGSWVSLTFTLPDTLTPGEWSIIISNPEQRVSLNVPVILRVK